MWKEEFLKIESTYPGLLNYIDKHIKTTCIDIEEYVMSWEEIAVEVFEEFLLSLEKQL